MVKDTTLYDRLGISPPSNQDEIKKAYRKNAIKHHPDKNPNNKEAAETKFKEINEAYAILSDENKKNTYDRFGLEAANDGGGGFDHSDIFEQFFGGGMSGGMGGMGGMGSMPEGMPFESLFGGNRRDKRRQENLDIMVEYSISLESIYLGKKADVSYSVNIKCNNCDGTGAKNKKKMTCQACDGKGMVTMTQRLGPGIMTQQTRPCQKCNGTGESVDPNNVCQNCNSQGLTNKKTSVNINIPPGFKDGNKIKINNKGHYSKHSSSKGALILIIKELKDDNFQRDNNNIMMEIDLRLYQSLFGFYKTIKYFGNEELLIMESGITEPNTIKVIKNKGLPVLETDRRGDLIIKFNVSFPRHLNIDEKAQNIVKKILSQTEDDKKEEQLEKQLVDNLDKYKMMVLNDYNPHTRDRYVNSDSDEEEMHQPGCAQS